MMPRRQRAVLPEVVHHVTQRGVDRIARDLRIATDDEGDAGHGGVVLDDQAAERGLITGRGARDRGLECRDVLHGDVRHMR